MNTSIHFQGRATSAEHIVAPVQTMSKHIFTLN